MLAAAGPAAAQALLLPDNATGLGVGVGTALFDDVADVAVGVTATLAPRLDVQASYGRAPITDGLTAYGLGASYYVQAEGGRRTAVSVGAQRVTGDRIDPVTVVAAGVTAGRQVDLGGALLLVPSVSAGLGAVLGDDLQASAGVEVLVATTGQTRVYGGPSVSLNSQRASLSRGLDRFAFGVVVGSVFGGASARRPASR